MWSPIEGAAVVTGLLSVWLTVRENVWCWPTGLVSVTLYIWVFYQAQLYADAGLQVVYILVSVYGWYHWLHGGAGRKPLRVQRASPAELTILIVLANLFATGLGYWLDTRTDATLPYPDALITSTSLVAQWALSRKLWENWAFWIAVDVLAIPVFWSKGLAPTAILYMVFLGMAMAGWREWRQKLGDGPLGDGLPGG